MYSNLSGFFCSDMKCVIRKIISTYSYNNTVDNVVISTINNLTIHV